MVASMNHTIQSEVTIPLRDVDPENDLSDPTSEQRTPFGNEGAGRNEQNVGRCKLKLSKKDFIIAILSVSFVISVGFNIFQHAQRKQVEAQTKQLEAMSTPKPFLTSSCPQGWIRNEESCYFFSDVESTWDLSHSNCSSYNASLLVMATPQEKAFIIENKAFAEYWLGHRRQDTREPWKDVCYVCNQRGWPLCLPQCRRGELHRLRQPPALDMLQRCPRCLRGTENTCLQGETTGASSRSQFLRSLF